jgi:septal ring factor EnvC (AmiA/AmiB activator)
VPHESVQVIETLKAEIDSLKTEVASLHKKLKTTETELGEADARIASLQELWHSKEIEAREMSARTAKAEQAAQLATTQRDAFFARIKDELSMHLLKERDASLTRLAELEKKLLSLPPG